jgi:hypothetical protein
VRQGQDLFGIFVIAALLLVLGEALLANLLGTRHTTLNSAKSSVQPQNAKSPQTVSAASNFNLPPLPSLKAKAQAVQEETRR